MTRAGVGDEKKKKGKAAQSRSTGAPPARVTLSAPLPAQLVAPALSRERGGAAGEETAEGRNGSGGVCPCFPPPRPL